MVLGHGWCTEGVCSQLVHRECLVMAGAPRVFAHGWCTEGAWSWLVHRGCLVMAGAPRVLGHGWCTEGVSSCLVHRGCLVMAGAPRVFGHGWCIEGAWSWLVHRGCLVMAGAPRVFNNNNSIYLYSAIYPELKSCSEALITTSACLSIMFGHGWCTEGAWSWLICGGVYRHYHCGFCCRLVQEHVKETRPGQGSLPLKRAVEMCICDEPCIVKHGTTSKTGLHIGMFWDSYC